MGSYYLHGLVVLDYDISAFIPDSNSTCPGPNPDIAGIGVVISFLVAGTITTVASITAAILGSRIDDDDSTIFLPGFVHRWLARDMTPTKREWCRFWRDILERFILNMADQQLITGFSLLIIGYIVEPWPLNLKGRLWSSRFALVVYLSCLSSSSHLACMLMLHKYLREHSGLAMLRVFFIILFALILSVSIGLGSTFLVIGYGLKLIFSRLIKTYDASLRLAGIFTYTSAPFIALYVYWTAVLQLLPSAKDRVKNAVRYIHRRFIRCIIPYNALNKLLGPRLSRSLGASVKIVFWWLLFLNPPIIFTLQVLFAMISIIFVVFQKFLGPTSKDRCVDCYQYQACVGLNNVDENKWGFGQMLAMFVLALPFLAALETYFEEKSKHRKRMATLQGLDKVPPLTPPLSHVTSVASLLSHDTTVSGAGSIVMPSPEIGASFNGIRSFQSSTSRYTPLHNAHPYNYSAENVNAHSSQTETSSAASMPLQRLYHQGTSSSMNE